MPKRVLKINNFHGGLNNSSDPRDIDDKEISASTNIMVDEVGRIRISGSNVQHDAPIIPGAVYDSSTPSQVSGSGLFFFNHDRQGAEAAQSTDEPGAVDEDGDSYLCLYDDSAGTGNVGPSIYIYSLDHNDWFEEFEDTDKGAIQFKGKTTSGVARPCFFSVDGSVRISDGEFKSYASGSLINMGSHFLSTDRILTADNGAHFIVGNYLRIEDEILYVKSKSTHDLTVIRGVFGTKIVQHNDNSTIYIVNMNQWYNYLNNKLFQTSDGISVYENNKWYNNIQHLRSLDELGIELSLYDAETSSPAASQIIQSNKIIVAYWYTTTGKDVGFWNGSYFIGLTPIYEGGQEGPISTVKNHIYSGSLLTAGHNNSTTSLLVDDGDDFVVNDIILVNAEKMKVTNISTNTLTVTRGYLGTTKTTHDDDDPVYVIKDSALNINEEILNVQLYITHPDLDGSDITSTDGHPLLDERITGLKLYTKQYTSDEWFLLKEFDLLEGGEHGWETYNSSSDTSKGYWDGSDTISVAAPSATASYDGENESNTCTVTLNLAVAKGPNRVGIIRLSGFENSPLYKEVDLNNLDAQARAFNVINPATGRHKFIAHLLDENFNIMARSEVEQDISDSGVDASPQESVGGDIGSGSS
jgi:hypothetical protein